MKYQKQNTSVYSGVILGQPRKLEKVTYLNVKTVEDGRTLQWVFFNKNHDAKDLRRVQNAQDGTIIKVNGSTNVNKATGQDQIVIQKLLSVTMPDDDVNELAAAVKQPSWQMQTEALDQDLEGKYAAYLASLSPEIALSMLLRCAYNVGLLSRGDS